VEVPEELKYTDQHEWLKVEDGTARVGITDFAQDALGDVVYVTFPELNKRYAKGDVLGEVESTKSVSEIYAPVTGVVTEINTELESRPELINRDPYGEGWLCAMTLEHPEELGQLLSATEYEQMLGSS
jgi:glycine cleavage system H protein